MKLYPYIRSLFGFPEYKQGSQSQRHDDEPYGSVLDESHEPFLNWDENSDFRTCPSHGSFGYYIFSSPVEIHRHFEQQMEAISRFFETFDNVFGGDPFHSHPPVSDQDQHRGKQDLRDRYMKPEYWHDSHESEWIAGNAGRKKKLDDDLDDRVSAGELDQILKAKPSMEKYEPRAQIRTFGKSSFNKIVTNSDGIVEHQHAVRDSEGNEEITVTQQIGDKRYSVTTHIDARGDKQEIENFVNIEKDDLDAFKKEWSRLRQIPQYSAIDKEPKPDHLSIFDQFFK